MPIYAYKCESCGHRQDVLQKISDPILTVCPACGASTYAKQVTAAGFQLKGSGWYVTDFRNGSAAGKPAAAEGVGEKPADAAAAPAPTPAGSDKPADKPASPAAAPAAAAVTAKADTPKTPASGA